MKKKHRGVLFVAGLLLAGALIAGVSLLSAKERSAEKSAATPFVWGLERLGAEPNIPSEKKSNYRMLIRDGGLFFNAKEMRDVISAGSCGADCDWCCCDSNGSCHCCE